MENQLSPLPPQVAFHEDLRNLPTGSAEERSGGMAPSFESVASLFCAEEASGYMWNDEADNYKTEGSTENPEESISDAKLLMDNHGDVSLLMAKETSYMPQKDYMQRFQTRYLDASSRDAAISWILKVQAHFNFGPLTTYLSVNYMDRFLSSHELQQGTTWMFQLLSVACVSLAAKMEEPEVPLLLDLQVEDAKHVFEARTIQRMEVLVLKTLKWRMSSVTPFSYLSHLFCKIDIHRFCCRTLLSRVVKLILGTCRVVNFLLHPPSVIAVAAVLCACEEIIPAEAPIYKNVLFTALPNSEETTEKCYVLMQELLADPFWTSKKNIAHARGSSHTGGGEPGRPASPVGVLDAACVMSCDSELSKGTGDGSPSSGGGVWSADSQVDTTTNSKKKRKWVEP